MVADRQREDHRGRVRMASAWRGNGTGRAWLGAGREGRLGVAWPSGIAGHLAGGLCRAQQSGEGEREQRENRERRDS